MGDGGISSPSSRLELDLRLTHSARWSSVLLTCIFYELRRCQWCPIIRGFLLYQFRYSLFRPHAECATPRSEVHAGIRIVQKRRTATLSMRSRLWDSFWADCMILRLFIHASLPACWFQERQALSRDHHCSSHVAELDPLVQTSLCSDHRTAQ